jgi:hypothetical protein
MSEWEHALQLDPNHGTARQFISYVRAQFPVLDDMTVESSKGGEVGLVPFGLEDLSDIVDEDSSSYDLYEIGGLQVGADADAEMQEFDRDQPTRGGVYASTIDEGWFLEDIALNLTAGRLEERPAERTVPVKASGSVELPALEFDDAADTRHREPKEDERTVELQSTDISELSVYAESGPHLLPNDPKPSPPPAPARTTSDKSWLEMLALEPDPVPKGAVAESPLLGLADEKTQMLDDGDLLTVEGFTSPSFGARESLERAAVPEPSESPSDMLEIEAMAPGDDYDAVPDPIPEPVRVAAKTTPPPVAARTTAAPPIATRPTVPPAVAGSAKTGLSEGKALNDPFAHGAEVPSTYTAKAAPETEILSLGRELAEEVFGERARPAPAAPAPAPMTELPKGIELPKSIDLPKSLDLDKGLDLPKGIDLPKAVDLPPMEEVKEDAVTDSFLTVDDFAPSQIATNLFEKAVPTGLGEPTRPQSPEELKIQQDLSEKPTSEFSAKDLSEKPTSEFSTKAAARLIRESTPAKAPNPNKSTSLGLGTAALRPEVGLMRKREESAAPPADPIQAALFRMRNDASRLISSNMSPDEELRARINFFFERAAKENSDDNILLAVHILTAAIDEAPDSAVGQKAIQANRDLILEIYRGYLGNPKATVSLAVTMQQLSQREIDARAAFLASRIDGTMSLEDLLDISGMPTLEAYQLLARLRMQGIIDLR